MKSDLHNGRHQGRYYSRTIAPHLLSRQKVPTPLLICTPLARVRKRGITNVNQWTHSPVIQQEYHWLIIVVAFAKYVSSDGGKILNTRGISLASGRKGQRTARRGWLSAEVLAVPLSVNNDRGGVQ